MDAKLKADWVKALRSGEYAQSRGLLYDGNGYCCLGVLCVVADFKISDDGNGVVGTKENTSLYNSYQPIFDLVGGIEKSHELSVRNDGLETRVGERAHKWSFPEIADWIEANIPAEPST